MADVTESAEVRGSGHVVALHISPARGIDMRAVERVEAEAGHGLAGDRYCNSRHRHVTVQAIEDLEAAAADLGSPIPAGATRRNITTRGITIPTRPGDRLTIGGLALEVVRVAAPCKLLDDWIAPGARTAMRRRGGAVARVLHGGVVGIGDPVMIDSATGSDQPG